MDFIDWLAEVCELLGQPLTTARAMADDPGWQVLFDEGCEPKEGIKYARDLQIL